MIYLDHNATTYIYTQVKQLINRLMDTPFNPSSIHTYGRKGKNIIEDSRRQIKSLVAANNKNDYRVIFTSSGTEANNLVLFNFKYADIFILAVEHSSILSATAKCNNIKTIKVDNKGIIDLDHLQSLLAKSNNDKKLVLVMLVNNETGIIQPIKKIVEIARKFNAIVHSDLVQAIGKIKVDIMDLDIDIATISGHKFGGPQGIGALIVKNNLLLEAEILGGGQEQGMRSGTENVSAVAGMGLAAEITITKLEDHTRQMYTLQQRLEQGLVKVASVIGQEVNRIPNTSLIVPNSKLDAVTQLIALDLKGFAVSSGSACSSGKVGRSHVLEAMNLSELSIRSAVRISTSYNNTAQEIDLFINAFKEINNL